MVVNGVSGEIGLPWAPSHNRARSSGFSMFSKIQKDKFVFCRSVCGDQVAQKNCATALTKVGMAVEEISTLPAITKLVSFQS